MGETSYHHGDLHTAMIEKGIEMINIDGYGNLSLRKVAAACGVSHAAPYSHFAGKEEFISAIQDHITEKLMHVLTTAVGESDDAMYGMLRMGCDYALFFARNPQYYSFLISRANIQVDFSDNSEGYEPFVYYKETMFKLFNEVGYPKELWLKTIITHWAFVHGLASIASIPGSGDIADWEKRIPDLIINLYFLNPGKPFANAEKLPEGGTT